MTTIPAEARARKAHARARQMLEHDAVAALDDDQRRALAGLAALIADCHDRHAARSMAFAYLCGYGADLPTMRAVSDAL